MKVKPIKTIKVKPINIFNYKGVNNMMAELEKSLWKKYSKITVNQLRHIPPPK